MIKNVGVDMTRTNNLSKILFFFFDEWKHIQVIKISQAERKFMEWTSTSIWKRSAVNAMEGSQSCGQWELIKITGINIHHPSPFSMCYCGNSLLTSEARAANNMGISHTQAHLIVDGSSCLMTSHKN